MRTTPRFPTTSFPWKPLTICQERFPPLRDISMAPCPRFSGTVFFPNSLSHGCDEHTYTCQTTVLAFDFENLFSSRRVRARKRGHTICLLVAESGLVWERTAEVCHRHCCLILRPMAPVPEGHSYGSVGRWPDIKGELGLGTGHISVNIPAICVTHAHLDSWYRDTFLAG